MKQIIFVSVLIVIAATARPQDVRLNTYATHVFDESFIYKQNGSVYYKGKIDQGLQLGAGIECFIDQKVGIELMYLRQNTGMLTTFEAGTSNPSKNRNYDVGLNYVMLGGNAYISGRNHKVEGYGGLFGGVAISDFDNTDGGTISSSTRLAWLARLGCNIWLTNKIGIKVQTSVSSAIQSFGKDFYFGAMGICTYACIWQYSLGGGLTFRLGK